MLRRVDEAKQWAIGDWLCDGKSHYGDGLYEKASIILGLEPQTLRVMASVANTLELLIRINNLSWNHHREVASIKRTEQEPSGKLYLSDEADYQKIQELLAKAEKEKLKVRDLRELVPTISAVCSAVFKTSLEVLKFSLFLSPPAFRRLSTASIRRTKSASVKLRRY